jgi:flavin reductase (DIM6/NTAB) family NADH-FMN oxidoreductase RutF
MKKSIGAKTIVYPAPVFIIGTYDKKNNPNVMNAAWGGISCSDPPCVSISLREATYTHGNIVDKGAFTVNIPSEDYVKEADYFGISSGRNEDKFKKSGLTPVRSKLVDAPYIEEFPHTLECKLVHTVEFGLHTHFTGQIIDVKVDENFLDNGNPNIELIKPFLYDHSFHAYYSVGKRLANAFSVGMEVMR